AKQRRQMLQPAPDRGRVQDIAVVIAFDEQILPGVDDVDVEIERHEALRILHACERKLAEIESRANSVDVEYDRDQRWTAWIALDRQLGQEAAERDVWMRLTFTEGCSHVFE